MLCLGVPCDCPAGAYVLPHRVVWLKLERATHHTVKLSDGIKAFLADGTDALGPCKDRETGEALRRNQLTRVVPMRLSLTAGEALTETDALEMTSLTLEELRARSFVRILDGRQPTT